MVTANQFFNPFNYDQKHQLEWDLSHEGSSIDLKVGLVKTFQVAKSEVRFKNSPFYNYPFSSGQVLETF